MDGPRQPLVELRDRVAGAAPADLHVVIVQGAEPYHPFLDDNGPMPPLPLALRHKPRLGFNTILPIEPKARVYYLGAEGPLGGFLECCRLAVSALRETYAAYDDWFAGAAGRLHTRDARHLADTVWPVLARDLLWQMPARSWLMERSSFGGDRWAPGVADVTTFTRDVFAVSAAALDGLIGGRGPTAETPDPIARDPALEARDKFAYEQYRAGVKSGEIRREIQMRWGGDVLTEPGLRSAVHRYSIRHGLPRPFRKKPGRPKGGK